MKLVQMMNQAAQMVLLRVVILSRIHLLAGHQQDQTDEFFHLT